MGLQAEGRTDTPERGGSFKVVVESRLGGRVLGSVFLLHIYSFDTSWRGVPGLPTLQVSP